MTQISENLASITGKVVNKCQGKEITEMNQKNCGNMSAEPIKFIFSLKKWVLSVIELLIGHVKITTFFKI